MKRCVLVLAVGVVFEALGAAPVRRDGDSWVQTVRGAVKIGGKGVLNVDTVGRVVVRGEAGQTASYILRKSSRAATAAGAQQEFEQVLLQTWTHGNAAYIRVRSGSGRSPRVELEISVPAGLSRARLRTEWGDLDITGVDGAVEAETAAGAIRADRIGGSLLARSGGGNIEMGWVGGTIHIQSGGGSVRIGKSGGEIRIETNGGEVAVREAGGPLHASTGGGNITAGYVAGSVTAETAGGSIAVERALGPVTAETSGGSIRVGSARGVRCESLAGAIHLRGVTGALRASTGVGNIIAEITGGRLADSILSTGGGDVTVWIPSNLAVTVRAQNESGARPARIVSDFPEVKVRPASTQFAVAEGAICGGGPVLTISTVNGVIYLRRQKRHE